MKFTSTRNVLKSFFWLINIMCLVQLDIFTEYVFTLNYYKLSINCIHIILIINIHIYYLICIIVLLYYKCNFAFTSRGNNFMTQHSAKTALLTVLFMLC